MRITRIAVTLTEQEAAEYDLGKENDDMGPSTRRGNRSRLEAVAEELAQGVANQSGGPIEVTLELPDLNDCDSWTQKPTQPAAQDSSIDT